MAAGPLGGCRSSSGAEFAGSRPEEVNMSSRLGHLLKCVTISLFLLFYFSPDAPAAQVQLTWDQSTDPSVIGYRIHYGTQSGNYSMPPVDAGNNLSITIDGLSASQTYYFAATAYSSLNESAFSPELVCDFITVVPSSNGQITPSGTIALAGGGSEEFSITPDTGYQVSDVLVDGRSVGASSNYTFAKVSGGHSIEAIFAPANYTITATAHAGGSISPPGTQTVNYGASQTFTIAPNTGYSVSSVVVDNIPQAVSTNYTFNRVTTNHTISATFASNTYTITASAGTGGSVSPSGRQAVPCGTNQSFTITPAANHKISSVYVDGEPITVTSNYTFWNVEANHQITVSFQPIEYTISASTYGRGSISPSGVISVSKGANVAYTITPSPYYRLSEVWIDGKPYESVSCGTLDPAVSGATSRKAFTYAFAHVSTDHTIRAVFSNVPPPVVDPGPDQDVKSGSVVKLDGSNSTDRVSGIASYKWTQSSGPHVNLSCPSAEHACTFTAPQTTGAEFLSFNLAVTNKAGITSSSFCIVNVSSTDEPPLANAGHNRCVHPYTIVTLDGLGSSDPDGKIVSYRWVQVQGPSVQIENADTPHATFVAPSPGPLGASLVFRLWVRDNFGLRTRDQTTINVVTVDEPPVANAGPHQTARAGTTVTLNGRGSHAASNSTDFSYRWRQISGVPVTLSNPTSISPAFSVPADTTGAKSDDLVFMLTVTDLHDKLIATSKCAVTIKPQ